MNWLEQRIENKLANWRKIRTKDIQSIAEKREMLRQIDIEIDLVYEHRNDCPVNPDIFGGLSNLCLTLTQEILEIINQKKL
nr:hypothetical protein HAGR004_41860 [Bdellovibrio sp. HAGR004]